MLAIIQAAGWPIYSIILASIIALAIIIERLVTLRRSQVLPDGLLAVTVQELKQSGVTSDMLSRLQANSPLGRVLAAGLKNVKSSREIMKESIEETGRAVAHDLDRFLTTLGTIATATPLLGLLGTVIGMIEMFSAQSGAAGNIGEMAQGIKIALYNTAAGIFVAVIALVFYRHFRATVDSLIVEMEQQAIKLVEVVHGERS
ncbi:MotA/TolQ/ExbB proton channel family protein [Chitinimonas sp. JJ19]|uniref:MotA/TolQ/ExbB proton channel family protein n=1 Tax=Chitinimonas sp. JJ19 TaxID=3109352 RepID=UPI003000F2BD